MDWKDIVKTVAPTIATALGTPLAGTAVKILADAILGDPDASESEVQKAITSGLTPETIVKIKEGEMAFAVRMKELDVDLDKLKADIEKAYLSDVSDARKANGNNKGVFWLGVAILVIFSISTTIALVGSMNSDGLDSTASYLIGSIIGYVAALAQQVCGYFFGSSRGSETKTNVMADAIKGFKRN